MSKIPGVENEVSTSSSEMKIPSQYDNVDWGAKTKLANRKVSSKSSKDGTVYGSKAIMTKEQISTLSFSDYLLLEDDKITALPEQIVGEIRKNISAGAKDLAQNWKNALELTHKAYQVSNVHLPQPDQKSAWKQYEEMIRFAVQKLAASRGLNGSWRTSGVLVREDSQLDEAETGGHIGTKRFFVEIPGEKAIEADARNMDEVIDAISNKIRNSRHVKGTKVRVEERTKTHCVLTVWVNEIKRERIIIKQV